MFTNKHVVVAMLVAPVLAIMAWFAIDYFVAERPHAAKPGAAYKLIAKSNCRYDSGQCDLENGDFKLTLRATGKSGENVTLALQSRFALQQATIGFIDGGQDRPPSMMVASDTAATQWSATVALPTGNLSTLGLAVKSQGANYFAEVPATFLTLER